MNPSSNTFNSRATSRRMFLTVGLMGSAATLSACEGGILKKTVYTETPAPLPTITQTTTQTVRPAEPQVPGVAADSLTVATGLSLIDGLDPVRNSDPLAVMINWHVFEGLYTIDRATGQPRNGLGIGAPVETGTNQYTIKLRDKITFHDGGPLTESDVSWNFNRMKTDGPFEIQALLTPITSMRLRGDSIVVTTVGPIPNLKERLSFVPFAPRLSQIANPDKFNRQQAVGTGPWKIEDMSKPGVIELRAAPTYSGDLPANFALLRFTTVPNEADRVKQFTDGSILAVDTLSAASAASITKTGRTVLTTQSTAPILLGFNCADPTLANPAVRRGIYTAAQAEKLASGKFKGNVTAATGFFAENHPAYSPSAVSPGAASGTFKVLTSNDELTSAITQEIVTAWKSAGITAEVESIPPADVSDRVRGGAFQIVIYADDPARYSSDADTMLRWFYDINAGAFNWAAAPERAGVLQAIDAADYAQAARLAATTCPVFPLLHRTQLIAFEPGLVAGAAPIATQGLDLLRAKTLPAPIK